MSNLKKEVVKSMKLQQLLCDLAYLDTENNPMFLFEYKQELEALAYAVRCRFELAMSIEFSNNVN